jgi:hypothetical protein
MKAKLYIVIISIFFFCIGHTCSAQADCTGADYHLNGNAVDSSWHHYDGILNGTSPANDRFGQADNAIYFNGFFDYILLPTLFDYDLRTISLWFYAENIGFTEQSLFVSDCNGLQYGRTSLSVCAIGGTKKLFFDAGGSQCSCTILENKWYMATISVKTDSTRFYLNGTLLSTQVTGTAHSSNGLYQAIVGSNRTANNNYFEGEIDQLKINPCAFTPDPSTGIVETMAKNISSVMVTPNPAHTSITVTSNEFEKGGSIGIYSQEGQLKYCQNNCSEVTLIDINSLEPGIYILKMTGAKSTSVARIVKE